MTESARDHVVAHQQALVAAGFGPLATDGVWGSATATATGRAVAAGLVRVHPPANAAAPVRIEPRAIVQSPPQSQVAAVYGPAGGARATAGRCILPFPFPLAWDASQRVSQFPCHEAVAYALSSIFTVAAQHFGEERFRALKLDQFGGCYNYRPMRNGTSLSMHAWGIAVDLDPVNNQLSWGRDRAAFARPEYEPFWRIVEAHGAVSLGRTRNFDWMHFQFATV